MINITENNLQKQPTSLQRPSFIPYIHALSEIFRSSHYSVHRAIHMGQVKLWPRE